MCGENTRTTRSYRSCGRFPGVMFSLVDVEIDRGVEDSEEMRDLSD